MIRYSRYQYVNRVLRRIRKLCIFDEMFWLTGMLSSHFLTHWGRVTHICVSKLTIIGSDNGLSPDRRQAIIWTNAGLLLNGPLGTNFSEILIEILTFSFKKMRLKVSSAKRRPFCRGLNVLTQVPITHSKILLMLFKPHFSDLARMTGYRDCSHNCCHQVV